jgi:nicotinamide mononucleotide adenylyltransferase
LAVEFVTIMTNKIVLLGCGSFNPITPMHLRMFEIAKDHFEQNDSCEVIGGIVSPVHDAYGKKGLVLQKHRLTMIRLALQSSKWIRLSEWETQQEEWSRTKNVLQFHQNYLNSVIRDLNGVIANNLPSWIPEGIRNNKDPVRVKLLCGADLLESLSTPGLWDTEDLEAILGQHGIVVVTRSGCNPEQFVFDSDLLSKYRRNITIITNWIANDVSSTLVRRFISRGLSVKYIMDDTVIDYINKNGLYKTISDT